MRFAAMDSVLLLQLAFFACGLGWAVTGSKIGKIVRVVGYAATSWIPGKPLTSLFFCPPCCTFWMGAGLGIWAGLPWWNIIQISFTSSFLMAILNAQWQLDANDREQIESMRWRSDAVAETGDKHDET